MFAKLTIKECVLNEKAVSQSQQRFMGMIDAIQKGKLDLNKLENPGKFKKAASSMSHKDVHDFASTKHKGLPEKVSEENTSVGNNNHKLIVEKGTGITPEQAKIAGEFIKFCCQKLGIKTPCKVYFVADREKYNMETLAYFNTGNNDIYVYAKNRLLCDILRSLAHEIRHYKQNLDGALTPESGKTGSKHENEANIFSGNVMRVAAKKWPAEYLIKNMHCDNAPVYMHFYIHAQRRKTHYYE